MKVKDLLALPCSFFINTYARPSSTVPVSSLFDGSLKKTKLEVMPWTEPQFKKEVEGKTSEALDKLLLQRVVKHGKDKLYNDLKGYQIALTPSGVFSERRMYDFLQASNPLVIIDIDVEPGKKNTKIKVDKSFVDSFKKYPWVVGAGESVSRQGVFILVYIENETLITEHFLALRQFFKEQGINADDLKDITRLRYLSYGYSWTRKATDTIKPFTDTVPVPVDDIYEVKQLEATTKYDNDHEIQNLLNTSGSIEEAGGLHPWTVRTAGRANKRGISMGYSVTAVWNVIKDQPIIANTPRYTFARFERDWTSIYQLYKDQHHLQTKVRITRGRINRFNYSIYKKSPKVLQDLVELVEQPEEKEVVYFSALILLGTLFPNRCFKYFNNTYHPMLYGYILGEAASFKGKAKIVRQAMRPYQQRIDELHRERNEEKNRMIAENKNAGKGQKQQIPKIPDLNFFFDGNTSSAAMLKAMQDSPVLCLFETEGDTITKTWKTDWGNYSDILRKAFEHEQLFSMKKSTGEENLVRIRIEHPKLAVLVSSTENQMRKVLNADETENGLMSRFLFYVVQNDKQWHNGFESNTDVDIESILTKRLSPEIWLNFTTSANQYYSISNEAQEMHQRYFQQVNDSWPSELYDIIAIVKRAGATTIRLALLLEELKNLDGVKNGVTVARHVINVECMQLAIDIMQILLQHLFVAWQITYKSEDFKETNVQTADIREQIEKILTKDPNRGFKSIAKELHIGEQQARGVVKKIKEGDKKKNGKLFE